MNHLVQQSVAGVVPVPLPLDLPPSSVSASLYDPDGVAVFTGTTITHPAHILTAAPAEGDTSLTFTWGSARVLQPGEEAFLAAASSAHQSPRETVIAKAAASTGLSLRSALRQAWAIGAQLVPKQALVPLTSTHTATLGRMYRVVVTFTYSYLAAGEQSYQVTRLVDVVAHVPRNPLTWARLANMQPATFSELSGYLKSDEAGMESIRQRAFEEVLSAVNRQLAPDLIINDSDLEPAILAMLHWVLAQEGILLRRETDRMNVIRHYRDEAKAALASCLEHLTWVDLDQDNVPDEHEQRTSMGQTIYFDPF